MYEEFENKEYIYDYAEEIRLSRKLIKLIDESDLAKNNAIICDALNKLKLHYEWQIENGYN